VDELRASIPAEFQPRAVSKGVLAGVHLGPRQVAVLAHTAGFRDDDLFTAVAVCGSESWLYTEAHNDNLDASGTVTSRDVGLWEINIPASEIGTSVEASLYDPQTNADHAFQLWKSRGWQPWVGFTSGAYLHDTYRIWAYLGVANRWSEIASGLAGTAGVASVVKVPAVSIPTARTLWKGVPLG
jgi:hypothetical protein